MKGRCVFFEEGNTQKFYIEGKEVTKKEWMGEFKPAKELTLEEMREISRKRAASIRDGLRTGRLSGKMWEELAEESELDAKDISRLFGR